MTRKKNQDQDQDQPQQAEPGPDEAAGEPTFAEVWAQVPPGSRMSRGVYSIYKTDDGGLHIAYKPDGAEDDLHLPFPPAMVSMMLAASEGKGPFGRLRAMAGGLR